MVSSDYTNEAEFWYMQDQIRDSVFNNESIAYDSVSLHRSVFIETRPSAVPDFHENLYSQDLSKENIPDWYLIVIILVLSSIATAKVIYGKFLDSIWNSAYSYQIASKAYKERGIVQQRFGLGLDFLYLVNASLFLYLLNRHFAPGIFKVEGFQFVFQAFIILGLLILLRITMMRLTAYIFDRSELFQGFLFHYFIYSKVLGIVLIPFLISIPYTTGNLQEIIIYTGISMVFAIQLIRLLRVSVYIIKNVILILNLILYLCILEILPFMIVIKVILSLTQV